ncbi:TetR/AcrR family transcriptional regulator [Acanthopleuribacter pedis]|uniref:TetR family transcriptional regulator n=1 Tax=Acanthopleuribacter pedis TaxID=442870 RepID=A0A8J7QA09_9BACT|nr:TetR family transcriptional regulator [Acanthopleuribacter pedis]MBO1319759.1 TetR family transcriptional regulator [Acanthopleuribacter pedis]
MGRHKNTDTRREQIVTALLQVMSAHGFEKASIRTIAEAAKLSPGLIHYHFKNKAEILHALIEQLADHARARYDHLSEGLTDPRAKIHAFITARLALGDGADPKAVAAWVVIGTEALRQEKVRELYSRAIETQMQILSDLLATLINEADAKKTAAVILAAMEGAYRLEAAASEIMPKNYAASTVRKMVDAMLDDAG